MRPLRETLLEQMSLEVATEWRRHHQDTMQETRFDGIQISRHSRAISIAPMSGSFNFKPVYS